ncbi:RusA family crossover junction endodeoxyribonuclease [Croceibacterium sp. LX-88]|uniref:RusA family crossover junction endodeoxyribonuclease n=1 Tax=Croceibacterium selenioxidans TaxID=2838833 RepID=A0ABS5W0T4_9SPHN|nr:RusA family crossover junction endodeoxyribonuclease [Croceibacterium selenioxidans]MBT2132702.1 RusA family crossover junction endodeoxyribonuclease [Croceibacterium selenioxidans]
MSDQETLFPFEVVLEGTPIALQCKTSATREAWKKRVNDAASERQRATYQLGFLDDRALAVTIYYFPSAPMEGDVDNIAKLILDGMISIAYLDDKVVERVTVQKFEPDGGWEFVVTSDMLALALDTEPPVVYIRVDDDLSWRTV